MGVKNSNSKKNLLSALIMISKSNAIYFKFSLTHDFTVNMNFFGFKAWKKTQLEKINLHHFKESILHTFSKLSQGLRFCAQHIYLEK